MRRLLLFCAVWTASVLSVGMVVGACSAQHDGTPAASGADASSRPVEQLKEVTIPRGTTLTFALDDAVGSATSRVDERVRGHRRRRRRGRRRGLCHVAARSRCRASRRHAADREAAGTDHRARPRASTC